MSRYAQGTQPKLSLGLIETICASIRSGCYVETSVALSGISKQTFYRWLRAAQQESADPLLIKLSDAVMRALATAELRDLEVIDKAAQNGNWQAAAWRLERKHPDRWGRQTKVQLEHFGESNQVRDINDTREALKRILADPEAFVAIQTLEDKLEFQEQDFDERA